MEQMSIVKKLTLARQELAAANLKKSGKNAHLGFDYFELSDFLPKVIELEAKYEMLSELNISNDRATLTIGDGNEEATFSCPFVMADLVKAQPTQNLGAAITYIKRYLYTMAYAVLENDVLDASIGEDEESKMPKHITDSQKNAIFRMNCNIENICKYYGVVSIDDLTQAEASEVIKKKIEQGRKNAD